MKLSVTLSSSLSSLKGYRKKERKKERTTTTKPTIKQTTNQPNNNTTTSHPPNNNKNKTKTASKQKTFRSFKHGKLKSFRCVYKNKSSQVVYFRNPSGGT